MPSRFDFRVLSMTLLVAMSTIIPTRVASADSLRCSGMVIDEGQPQSLVASSCGAPMTTSTYCAPVAIPYGMPGGTYPTYGGAYGVPSVSGGITDQYWVPGAGTVARHAAPVCMPVEEWVYDRGPGQMRAAATFSNGTLVRVTYRR